MSDESKVRVVEFGDRKHYQLQWTCPMTGRKKTKSSGVERTGKRQERDAAAKAASDLERELASGAAATGSKLTWEGFRERYAQHVAGEMAKATADKIEWTFNTVQNILAPKRLADLTTERLAWMQGEMRKRGLSESSIKSHAAHLKAALRWAGKMKLLRQVPEVSLPRKADKSRGRAVTGEEFERMLEAVPKVIRGEAAVVAWRHYLRGLWLSGLRLQESLALRWDGDRCLRVVDLDGKRPKLFIPGDAQKSGKTQFCAAAPEFAEFLRQTPPSERKGRVFKLDGQQGQLGHHRVSQMTRRIGKAAGVVVDVADSGRVAYAGCHDLRRAFGFRWSRRVMPAVLKELMRHANVATTMAFYVTADAESTSDVLWQAHEAASGNTCGNSLDSSPKHEKSGKP